MGINGIKKEILDPWRLSFQKPIPCHPEDCIFIKCLVAHLVIVVLVLVLTALVLFVIVLIVLHVVGRDLGVVNDLAAGATTTLDDVALVDGVTVALAVFLVLCGPLVQ